MQAPVCLGERFRKREREKRIEYLKENYLVSDDNQDQLRLSDDAERHEENRVVIEGWIDG